MRIWFYVAKTIISLFADSIIIIHTRPFIQSKLRWKIESFYEIYKLFSQLRHQIGIGWLVGLMVFNATFNNISVISWRSVLLVEETGGPRKNHRPVASHWQALSHNVVHLALIGIQTHNIRIGKYEQITCYRKLLFLIVCQYSYSCILKKHKSLIWCTWSNLRFTDPLRIHASLVF